MKRVEARGLCYSYGRGQALAGASMYAARGEFVGVIGPNGSGKSTLLKCLYRALKPESGEIFIDGVDARKMSARETARKIAVVGQENELIFDFSVHNVVAMGRSPHKKFFESDSAEDERIIAHALEHVGMEREAHRRYSCLSGGEKQRVMIARAIAQETDFMILDEPTNHLDISCQLDIFDFVKRLNLTVVAAIHDLNMAALYCDRLYVMKCGKIVREGVPAEILTPAMIAEVYGVTAETTLHASTKRPFVTYLPQWAVEKNKPNNLEG